jgi:acetylornithine/succinyldiaminopimelate/putrescine aminotransferase
VHDAKVKGDDLAYILMKLGLLTKASHDFSIRLAPALIIKEKEVLEASKIIKEGIKELEKLNNERSK